MTFILKYTFKVDIFFLNVLAKFNIKNENAIYQVIESLKNGGVILCPTDTVYGLICDAGNTSAIDKIYKIKARDYAKKFAIFTPCVNEIHNFCKISEVHLQIFKSLLPGGFTFVCQINKNFKNKNEWLTDYENIGIRLPNNEFLLKLLKIFNKPLVATSANTSNTNDSSVFENIQNEIKNSVDLCIFDDFKEEKDASSVIDLQNFDNNYQYTILRNTKYVNDFINTVNKIKNA